MELEETTVFCVLLVVSWLGVTSVSGGQTWIQSNSGGHRSSGRTSYWGSSRLGSGRGSHRDGFQGAAQYKRDLGLETFTASERKKLAELDKTFAVMDSMERIEQQHNCTKGSTLSQSNIKLPNSSYDQFNNQTEAVVRTANVLNNIFRKWENSDPDSLYNDVFYYSLIRALVNSDKVLYGSSIAFDKNQYGANNFCPHVYRYRGRLEAKDLAKVSNGRYTVNGTDGYEWYWKQRQKDFTTLLSEHREICTHARQAVVVSTKAHGLWTSPYYDCHGSQSWMVTYSVPFFGCTSEERTLRFK
jgi:hypothetical protein